MDMRGVVGVADAVVLVQALGQKREERQVVCDDMPLPPAVPACPAISSPSSLPPFLPPWTKQTEAEYCHGGCGEPCARTGEWVITR